MRFWMGWKMASLLRTISFHDSDVSVKPKITITERDDMTIGNALNFIKRGLEDSDLRGRLNAATSLQEIDQILVEENLLFSAHDFDEAYHHQLTLCWAMEAAEQLKEFKLWWDILLRTLEPASCETQCSGCCA